MSTFRQNSGSSQTLVALVALAALSPAQAQELATPQSSVSLGVGVVSGESKDRARFGMFNGMRDHSEFGLLGIDYAARDDATGTWTILEGRNLGLDNRELRFSVQEQGSWKLLGEYSEITRHDPRTINTGLMGAGTTSPTVVLLSAPGTGQDLDLQLKRKSFTLGGDRWFGGSLQFEVNFKNEDKNGARLFGRGFTCPSGAAPSPTCTTMAAGVNAWALLLLPEPIDSSIKQIDTKLNFNTDKMLLTGGYYGSFYRNYNGSMTASVPGTLNDPLGTPTALNAGLQGILQTPMALPPNSESHQLYLQGNYRFTPTTRSTFKLAYSHATQKEDFLGMGLTDAPAGRNNLGGVMNTTLGQFGLSTRPMSKLSLTANLRYEAKENKTPIDTYNTEGTSTFTNGNPSPRKRAAKLEASYQLPDNYRATLGLDYEGVDHGTVTPTESVAGITGLRQKTKETGYRLELQRNMSETLTGRVSYVTSRRNGDSPWLKPNALPATGVIEGDPTCTGGAATNCLYNRTAIFPFIFEDRVRDKVRLMTNWTPFDRLSLQFFVEEGKDKYSGPTEHGLRDSGMRMLSVDASYALSDMWRLTGYASQGEQTVHAGHSTGYDAALKDIATSFGLGIVGKPSGQLQLGADLTFLEDVLKYHQEQDPLANAANTAFLAASGGLPDVTYRLVRLKLFGQYALDRNASVRIDFIHHRTYFNEWTYSYNGVPFTYSDNTTIKAEQDQRVSFVGASYIYRWQ